MGPADAPADDERPEDPPPLPDEADGVTVSLKRFCRLFPEAPDDPASPGYDVDGSDEAGSDKVSSGEAGSDGDGPDDEPGSEG